MRRPIRMTAKKAGVCRLCGKPINVGNLILWAKGSGASHVDCTTSNTLNAQCSACNGSGRTWKNDPCPVCGGNGAKASNAIERALDVDALYEDACARACGL